jgi:photosystem II stability/assembly factor-like uncharacterized protein
VGSLPAKAGASAVAVDPKQPKRVYAAGTTGLFRSDDAGETWNLATNGLPSGGVAALALDPQSPGRLYAATSTGALYLSTDGATTWKELTGTQAHAGS